MNLAPIDLPPERAARRLARARRVFLREAGRASAAWPVRAEAAFGRRVEPWLAGLGATAMALWALAVALG